jgi:hypothetical protein
MIVYKFILGGLRHFKSITKTLQKHNQSANIRLYAIPNSAVCPVAVFVELLCVYSVRQMDPLLSQRVRGSLQVITQSDLRQVLKKLIVALHSYPYLGFHAFRHSGASLAFASGVPFQAIHAHGTWSSDALWAYIDVDTRESLVSRCFSTVFAGLWCWVWGCNFAYSIVFVKLLLYYNNIICMY